MKKNIILIAAIVMAAVSCTKETAPEYVNDEPAKGKLTATFVQTKVSYTVTSGNNLQPAWEVGDEIIGFDDAGNTYTLTVASVSEETATLEGSLPDGSVHLIYKSGASASDIKSKTLTVSYDMQNGDKTMPAVMLADGTVKDGGCNFKFANAGAIIGINAVNGIPSGTVINKISVYGENISEAAVALSGSALSLSATEKTGDFVSAAGLSGITVTDAEGTLSKPVFIAVPAGATIKKICAEGFVYEPASPRTVAGGEYLYITKGRTFSYKTYTCHVRYLDDSNIEIARSNTILAIPCGETITETAIEITGYQVQGESVITRTIWEDTTIEFHYAPEVTPQWTYTVKYLDVLNGGVPIADDKVDFCMEGQLIYEEAIPILGYRCVGPSSIEVEITRDKQEIIFFYMSN